MRYFWGILTIILLWVPQYRECGFIFTFLHIVIGIDHTPSIVYIVILILNTMILFIRKQIDRDKKKYINERDDDFIKTNAEDNKGKS